MKISSETWDRKKKKKKRRKAGDDRDEGDRNHAAAHVSALLSDLDA